MARPGVRKEAGIPPTADTRDKRNVGQGTRGARSLSVTWRGALGRFGVLDREKVNEAMTLSDVRGMADRLVDTLSGGERQRVWLAMLAAQDAECLLPDEPISALDVAHQIEMLSLVQQLSRAKGLGVPVVLHDINMAARYCDEIIALHSGSLIARGTSSDIFTPQVLKDIYSIDMAIMAHPLTRYPMASRSISSHRSDHHRP